MSRSKFNERNQGTRPPDDVPAATGQAATDARARAGGRSDTDDLSDADNLLDTVLREMTRLDDGQADAEAARRITAAVRAASAASRQARRSGSPGELGRVAETMPRLAWAMAALVLCAVVGGSLWWSTRPARSARPAESAAPVAAAAPAAPAAEPPHSGPSSVGDAAPRLASAGVTPSRSDASSPSLRALSVERVSPGRTTEASLREDTQDAPLGDPIDPLEVASIEPALLEEPAALETMPLATGRIAITPIRIDPFDAPVTPRSH